MAREKGTFNFSANLEVKKQGPLDARQTMITYAELTQAATWQDENSKMYLFNGLIVPVTNGSEKQVYMLIDADNYNQTASWQRIDGGESEVYLCPGDALTLTQGMSDTQVNDILGTAGEWKEAVNGHKLIVSNTSKGMLLLAAKVDGFFVYYLDNNNPIVFNVSLSDDSGTNWMTTAVFKVDTINLATTETGSSDIYRIGDITSLEDESDVSTIKSVLGTVTDLKGAISNKKLIIAQTSAGVLFVLANDNASNITLSATVGLGIGNYTVNYSGSEWTSVSVESAEFAQKGKVVESVKATSNRGIEIGGTTTNPTVGLQIDNTTKGNVDLSVGANGLKANFTETTKGVKSGDKVLKVESDKTISSTISLGYNSGTKKLQLKGINDEVFNELDVTPFIKDGMLDSAVLEVNPSGQSAGTYIKLVFNTDSGKEPIYINVTSLIDVYTQGNGISVSGKTISVKLDSSTESYLSLSAAGLKLSGVNQAIADAIKEAFSWHEA